MELNISKSKEEEKSELHTINSKEEKSIKSTSKDSIEASIVQDIEESDKSSYDNKDEENIKSDVSGASMEHESDNLSAISTTPTTDEALFTMTEVTTDNVPENKSIINNSTTEDDDEDEVLKEIHEVDKESPDSDEPGNINSPPVNHLRPHADSINSTTLMKSKLPPPLQKDPKLRPASIDPKQLPPISYNRTQSGNAFIANARFLDDLRRAYIQDLKS